jgi:hypothetical protein
MYYNSIILWNHRRISGPSLTETSLLGAYLYLLTRSIADYFTHTPAKL